jgi:hypothetical protein
MRGVVAAVFCDPPRPVPHARLLSVAFRTLHLVAFGLLLGGHAFGVPAERLVLSLWLTVGSGAFLMGLETAASARWLLEGRGLAVIAKLALLLAVTAAWEHRVPLLFAVVALAGITSHMPGRFRHASWLGLWPAVARFAALAEVHEAIASKE